MNAVHTPVLLQECLALLSPLGEPYEQDAYMIDSTLGEGGHSFAFLSAYSGLSVTGVDADSCIQAAAKERLAAFGGRISFCSGWFDDFFRDYPDSARRPDIILFDLGISVFHYERSGRGFSFRHEEPLDMRLRSQSGRSAGDIVNGSPEEDLAGILYAYGEERYSRRIAAAISSARRGGRIESSKALADIIYEAVPARYRHGAIHPATRSFQALRIAVNEELRRLPQALADSFDVLAVGGKMGVITFHSLEDRIVKRYFRGLGMQCVCPPERAECACGGRPCAELLTRRPVVPAVAEVADNPPSRSAKLRVVRKIGIVSPQRKADMMMEGI